MFRGFPLCLLVAVSTSFLCAPSNAFPSFGGLKDAVKNAQSNPAAFLDAAAKGMDGIELEGAMGEAIKFLKDPSVVESTKKALESLQSGNILDLVLDHQDYFVDQMEKSGMVPESILSVYKNDGKRLTKDIKAAQKIVVDIFKNPGDFQDALDDPKKFLIKTMMPNGKESSTLKDFQKRFETVMENPILKTICQSDEMKTLVSNPSKWVEMAQKFAAGEL